MCRGLCEVVILEEENLVHMCLNLVPAEILPVCRIEDNMKENHILKPRLSQNSVSLKHRSACFLCAGQMERTGGNVLDKSASNRRLQVTQQRGMGVLVFQLSKSS